MGIVVKLPSGERISLEADTTMVGTDATCQVRLPADRRVQPKHAKIRRTAGRWLIESAGEWPLWVGNNPPGRMGWLQPGIAVRLAETGPELIFEANQLTQVPQTSAPVPPSAPSQWSVPIPPMFEPNPSPRYEPPIPPPVRTTPLKWAEPTHSLPNPIRNHPEAETRCWYYTSNGSRSGPVTENELKAIALRNQLLADSLVWKEGMPDWKPAVEIRGLLPSASPPALPLSVPPPLPARHQGVEPTNESGASLSSFSAPVPTVIWVKVINGVGLALAVIGLFCPWFSYQVSYQASYESSASFDPGSFASQGGGRPTIGKEIGGFGSAGNSRPMSASASASASGESSTTLTGISTVPGMLILIGLVVCGALCFLGWRWATFGSVVSAGIVTLLILGSFAFNSFGTSSNLGNKGPTTASGSAKLSSLWGQWPTLVGSVSIVTVQVLALFGVGVANDSTRKPGRKSSEGQSAGLGADASPFGSGEGN